MPLFDERRHPALSLLNFVFGAVAWAALLGSIFIFFQVIEWALL